MLPFSIKTLLYAAISTAVAGAIVYLFWDLARTKQKLDGERKLNSRSLTPYDVNQILKKELAPLQQKLNALAQSARSTPSTSPPHHATSDSHTQNNPGASLHVLRHNATIRKPHEVATPPMTQQAVPQDMSDTTQGLQGQSQQQQQLHIAPAPPPASTEQELPAMQYESVPSYHSMTNVPEPTMPPPQPSVEIESTGTSENELSMEALTAQLLGTQTEEVADKHSEPIIPTPPLPVSHQDRNEPGVEDEDQHDVATGTMNMEEDE